MYACYRIYVKTGSRKGRVYFNEVDYYQPVGSDYMTLEDAQEDLAEFSYQDRCEGKIREYQIRAYRSMEYSKYQKLISGYDIIDY